MVNTVSNTIILTPSQAKQAVRACISKNQPVCLWGPPGCGKSDLWRQVATELNEQYIDFRGSQMDAVDTRGIPCVEDRKTHWCTPDVFPASGSGILVAEELNRAPMLVMSALLSLFRERSLGDYTLPDDWKLGAACNWETSAGTFRMPDALYGRFLHINVEPDPTDWCNWAVKSGINPTVIAFIRFRPTALSRTDKNSHANPSPRTWEFVSTISGQGVSPEVARALYAGAVGQGEAIEYIAFERMANELPDIDSIIANPKKAKVPTEANQLYAIASALGRKSNAENFDNVVKYLERLPVEFNVMAVRDGIVRDDAIQNTDAFADWAVTHTDITL